jgi:hypothetical protein
MKADTTINMQERLGFAAGAFCCAVKAGKAHV